MMRIVACAGGALVVFGVIVGIAPQAGFAASAKSGNRAAAMTGDANTRVIDSTIASARQPQGLRSASASNLEMWSVFGDGGAAGSSATYTLSYTTGQSSSGKGAGHALDLQVGFWQNFSTSCCQGRAGNLNLTGIVDASDLCVLVNFLTDGGIPLTCYDEGNVTGTGIVDLADLSALVNYLTGGGYLLPYCQ